MAALASSAVTHVKSWMTPGNPVPIKSRLLDLALTGHGGATNTIDASTLGLTKIYRSSMAQEDDDSRALPSCPSYDGSKLFLYNPAEATDANRDDPYDATGTFRVLVEGY